MNLAKVNRIEEEEAALLAEPLLAEVDEFSAQLLESFNSRNRMETTTPTGGSTDNNNFSSRMSSMMMTNNNPIVRGTIAWCLRIRTLADALPPMLQPVVANGKMSVFFFMGGQLVLFLTW